MSAGSPERDTVPVGPGVDLYCAMPELDGSVEVGLVHDGEVGDEARLDAAAPRKKLALERGPLRAELELSVDASRGELRAGGHVQVRDPLLDQWHTIVELDERALLRYSPARGTVGDDPEPEPPAVDDPRFGRSQASSKKVTRFFVDDRKSLLTDVGRRVKGALWRDHPDFVFNTVACVGAFQPDGRGAYGDPLSPWFNVFLGYYQIDAPKPEWSRPFGYEAARGIDSKLEPEDLVRLGKSDWNHFSNWMYGVPEDEVAPHDEVDMTAVRSSQAPAQLVGSSLWHLVDLAGVDFVSAYESEDPGAGRLVDNSVLSGLWRRSFGQPCPRTEWKRSFVGTTVDARLYMAYREDDEAFRTVMFGGTALAGADPAFLDVQLAAAGEAIARRYATLGFAAD